MNIPLLDTVFLVQGSTNYVGLSSYTPGTTLDSNRIYSLSKTRTWRTKQEPRNKTRTRRTKQEPWEQNKIQENKNKNQENKTRIRRTKQEPREQNKNQENKTRTQRTKQEPGEQNKNQKKKTRTQRTKQEPGDFSAVKTKVFYRAWSKCKKSLLAYSHSFFWKSSSLGSVCSIYRTCSSQLQWSEHNFWFLLTEYSLKLVCFSCFVIWWAWYILETLVVQ